MANHLSESGTERVLLLEAGAPAPAIMKSVAALAYLDISRFRNRMQRAERERTIGSAVA
jgi:hypothetical protein